ncbi:MAG: glycosyltransferase [Bacteroidetes bacterium]|jgi:glycosyltransferase involved in cell wall biosynthesis|nr:glycosyltransferase [Bacteroidota bacterium]
MKIIYCIAGLRHSGGMERVLTNKANYLVDKGMEVLIVTTDQYGENNFFALSPKVRTVDLAINYEENNGKSIWNKIVHYPFKQYSHWKKLSKLLKNERAGIVISMFCNDVSFLWRIKDGSKKVLEIHFSRYKRLQYGRTGIWGLGDKLRSWMDLRTVCRYDRFVVLTKEDAGYWGNLPNIQVIPNARTFCPESSASLDYKRVIAVGRYDYQKGFDDLIAAWKIVAQTHNEWKLDIFGNGQLKEVLNIQINEAGLRECVSLKPPVSHIGEELLQSSLFAMSSRYEGLPMVLLESQAYGLPIVSYACKCGPRDVITDGVDGFLVPEGDISGFANKLLQLIEDSDLRKQMGYLARKNSARFSEEKIMKQWLDLFRDLC